MYIQAQYRGFLGLDLPTTYVVIAISVMIVTLLAGMTYLLHKKSGMTKMEAKNYGST